MTKDELRRLAPNASQDVIELNLGNPDDLRATKAQQKGEEGSRKSSGLSPKLERSARTPTVRKAKAKARDTRRFRVRVISVRDTLLDEDNLCEKYHLDCLRYSGLLPDDCPEQCKVETTQRKAQEGEEQHTIIELTELSND